MAEKLNWEFEEDEDKPKSVDELIKYFKMSLKKIVSLNTLVKKLKH